MIKTVLSAALLIFTALALRAADYSLYAGRPQTIVLSGLKPGEQCRWELRAMHDRIMGGGQLKADEKGKAELTLEIPALEEGVMLETKLLLPPSLKYVVTFYSARVFGDALAEFKRRGIFADTSELSRSLEKTGVTPAESPAAAEILLLAEKPWREAVSLAAGGKTVVYWPDSETTLNPSREGWTGVRMVRGGNDVVAANLSLTYSKTEFTVGCDGDAVLVAIDYRGGGRLVIAAAATRTRLELNPELWLLLKTQIKGEK